MCKAPSCLVSSTLVLSLFLVCAADAADPSLLAHYRLDEGAGMTAYDSSGNGYDGQLLGTPEWVAGPDDSGVALTFNPTNACTGIECPTFDPTDGTGQFSFTVWAFWDGEETYHHFFTKSDAWGEATMMFQLELWGGSTSAAHFNRVGISYAPDSIPFYEMPKNEWTHLAFVYDGTNMVVYFNGADDMGPKAVAIGAATNARTVIGVANDDARVWTGVLDDVQIYSRPLTAGEVAKVMEGNVALSSAPQPEDEATDVPRDVTLGWGAGEFAATHDVYLGTVFEDVNDADRSNPGDMLVSQGQTATTYDPEEGLALGQTYYWRVDEVNAAPDYAIFKGEVWSFTIEPFGYPISGVTATSNADSQADAGPENTTNGSGLDADDRHSIDDSDMWLTSVTAEPVWIQYAFDGVYKLHEMQVWNYNGQFELILGFGLKDVTVEYSSDGVEWTALEEVTLGQATGRSDYAANTTVAFNSVAAGYVRLVVNSGYGTMGQYGLSEVRFLSIPVQARQPEPVDGAIEVTLDTVLAWRAGRGAVTHEVYLSSDFEAVSEGIALVGTVAESSHAASDLEFGNVYYWKVTEVNEAAPIAAWDSAVWSFTTQQYAGVEDFEAYDDEDNRIYETWLDGWVNETGSIVGYLEEPFAERSIVHGGRQSMPLAYDNGASPFYSETSRTWPSAQDWTVGGANSLRLFFQGAADNTAETLYAAVKDRLGHVAVVTHPDPDAALATDWQTWTIPFTTVADAGVNLAQVETLFIGLGNRANPTAGGTGLVYIDDVSFGTPLTD